MANLNRFPTGISDFTTVLEKKLRFVDKTMLIKDIIEDSAGIILITRPRRFGKTLNMSMLQAFLSKDGKDLFGKLNIAKEELFCKIHQNKYPVIFMSFKDVKGKTFDDLIYQLRIEFSIIYGDHAYLLESNILTDDERAEFMAIRGKRPGIDLRDALRTLTSHIHKVTGAKPIVLLDEYDTPIHSAFLHDFYDDLVDFMRSLLSRAFKDNIHLEKGVMTGILRVAKESMFSGLNNLSVYTVLHDRYAQYFGFTQEEVESLIPEESPLLIEQIKEWYNGYQIGNHKIYNPWSIILCLSNNASLEPYWINTSDNALVRDLINHADSSVKETLEKLIRGEPQLQYVHDDITFKSIRNNSSSLWMFLLHGGYLNAVSIEVGNLAQKLATLELPNKEILSLFAQIVENWFYLENNNPMFYIHFIKSLEKDDPKDFFGFIQKFMKSSMSYFDLNKNTPEQVFHVFMMGLLVGFKGIYDVKSNMESGDGRCDIIMTPLHNDRKTIVMEFKTCATKDELPQTAQKALTQIREKQYTSPFAGKTLAIGIAFCGKDIAHEYVIDEKCP